MKFLVPEELRQQGYMTISEVSAKLLATPYKVKKYIAEKGVETKPYDTGKRVYPLVKIGDLAGLINWMGEGKIKDDAWFTVADFSQRGNISEDETTNLIDSMLLKSKTVDGEVMVSGKKAEEVLATYKRDKINIKAFSEIRESRERAEEIHAESFSGRLKKLVDGTELRKMSAKYGIEREIERLLSYDSSLEPTLGYIIGRDPTSIELETVRNLDRIVSGLESIGGDRAAKFINRFKRARKDPFKASYRNLIMEALVFLEGPEGDGNSL